MKIALLFPKFYTLSDIFFDGLKELGHEVVLIDYMDFFSNTNISINSYLVRFPYNIRKGYEKNRLNLINKKYLRILTKMKPDIIIVYNDQMLVKETIIELKKFSRVIHFLGDNPLYIQKRPFNLAALLESDLILSPDSFWIEQLKIIGVKNIRFFLFASNPKVCYKKVLTKEEKKKFHGDVVFIGRQYFDSFGYKRALFYSKLIDFDFKIYGDKTWKYWLQYFPELRSKLIIKEKYLSNEEVNTIMNCNKIYPIDANPGLLNGVHLRILDCISAGILPVAEYRKDIDYVFKGVYLPVIKNYNEVKEIVAYYLRNEQERINVINNLRNFVNQNYLLNKSLSDIINYI